MAGPRQLSGSPIPHRGTDGPREGGGAADTDRDAASPAAIPQGAGAADTDRDAASSAAIPWEEAWQVALYGPDGFYRGAGGPARHFATSAHGPVGALFAQALLALAEGAGLTTIIDFAAGRGELSTHLGQAWAAGVLGRDAVAPSQHRRPAWRVIAVDVVPRPDDLDESVQWVAAPGGSSVPDLRSFGPALVVANEWLDVVPCPVVGVDAGGLERLILVDAAGNESLGEPPTDLDAAWLTRWWPRSGRTPALTPEGASAGRDDVGLRREVGGHRTEVGGHRAEVGGHRAEVGGHRAEVGGHRAEVGGHRAEVGRSRDAAYAALLDAVAPGSLVIAIDYGHTRTTRPEGGSLVGYRGGAQVAPVPDGSCDLTAHVAMDSLGADRLLSQREALRELGISGERPAYELSRTDPMAYLTALSRAGAAGALTGPGLGGFWWAITRR